MTIAPDISQRTLVQTFQFLNHYDPPKQPKEITVSVYANPTHIEATTKADIDDDGAGGNFWNDPDFQPDTTEHVAGQPLNAETTPYNVVPAAIIDAVEETVMGCLCQATNTQTGQEIDTVTADRGPAHKLGEVSPATAQSIGLPPSGLDGGTSDDIILYRWFPGIPAVINGVTYPLQPA